MTTKKTIIVYSTLSIPAALGFVVLFFNLIPESILGTSVILGCILFLFLLSIIFIQISSHKHEKLAQQKEQPGEIKEETIPQPKTKKGDVLMDTKGLLAVSEPEYEEFKKAICKH